MYAALRDAGMSNREIARHLGVNEASVRRGLSGYTPPAPESESPEKRYLITVTPVD